MVRRFQAVGTQWGYSGDTEGKARSTSTHCLQGPGVGGQRRARSGWRGRHGSARAGPVTWRQCPGFIQGLRGLGWECSHTAISTSSPGQPTPACTSAWGVLVPPEKHSPGPVIQAGPLFHPPH